jgi:hypothetical protein
MPRDRGFGIGETSTPPGLHVLHRVGDRCGFLRLGHGRGLGLLLRQLTRMHHDQAHRLLSDPPIAVLHLDRPHDALPMPASWRLVLGPRRCLHPQGQRRRLRPPRVEGLPHGTDARDYGHQTDPLLQASPSGTTTVALTIGHDPLDPLEPSRETLLHSQRRLHTITPVAIPHAQTPGEAAIPANPETSQPLLAIVTAIVAVPIGGPWSRWGL